MNATKTRVQRKRRHLRVRAKVQGTPERPRLAVSRSNQHVYAQIIDDTTGRVLVACSDLKLKPKKTGVEAAKAVGEAVAKEAIAKKISRVVFDRGGYQYHGQVATLAEAARQGGLTF